MHSILKLAVLTLTISIANAENPEFKTKQSLSNIRYISPDGKLTYYQKLSGTLQLSTNYNFKTILKNPKNTFYNVVVANDQSQIAVEIIPENFTRLNFQKDHRIVKLPYNSDQKLVEVGYGTHPQFHLNSQWISYYNFKSQSIVLTNGKTKKEVKVLNKINPFYIPQIHMLTPNDFIYTDINKEGYEAVIMYSLAEKSFEVIYKAKLPTLKLEICRFNDSLIIGTFPRDGYSKGTSILKGNLFTPNIENSLKYLYTSNAADIGNMVCKNNFVYFIKTLKLNDPINLKNSEVAKLDINKKAKENLEVISDLDHVTQILELGGMILGSYRGKYYILDGQSPLKSDAL